MRNSIPGRGGGPSKRINKETWPQFFARAAIVHETPLDVIDRIQLKTLCDN